VIRLLEVGLRCPPESFVQRKLDGLVARGIEVSVASLLPRGVECPHPDIRLHRIPPLEERPLLLPAQVAWGCIVLLVSRPRRLRAALRAATGPTVDGSRSVRAFLAELRVHLRFARIRADLVHFEWTFSAVRWLAVLDVLGCPAVISCRGSDINSRSHDPRYEGWLPGLARSFDRSAAVHCVSAAIRGEAVRYGLCDSKAQVIRPAVDAGFYRPADEASDTASLRLVTISDLRWVKGLEYALLAVRELVARGVQVQLELIGDDPAREVGESSERQRLLYAIEDLGLERHVRLRGRLPAAGVRARLQRAHALLHASLSEGIPNVVLEAMACGLPVVVTDAGGTGEAVRTGVEGFMVGRREPAELADALTELWRDPALRARMGSQARRRAVESFSLDRESDAYARLYEGLARGERTPA
jgi:glycosyltransferase involved in cell wall biosynthesis